MCSGDRDKTGDNHHATSYLYGTTSVSQCGRQEITNDLTFTSTGSEQQQNPGWCKHTFHVVNNETQSEQDRFGASSSACPPINTDELAGLHLHPTHVKKGSKRWPGHVDVRMMYELRRVCTRCCEYNKKLWTVIVLSILVDYNSISLCLKTSNTNATSMQHRLLQHQCLEGTTVSLVDGRSEGSNSEGIGGRWVANDLK